ncbi:MAG: LacI family transcriptional regulator [Cellulomonadaceae bacterium]|nr:LacI family transcriptional regulator [Cellulomonadaceae bacterium]
MSDVAHHAGVSRQLVSLVLRGAPGPSAASRVAVLASAEALDFRVNTSARLLRQEHTRLVGVLFSARNSFELQFVERLVELARTTDLDVVLAPMTPSRGTDDVVTELLGYRVEALACFNPEPGSAALRRAIDLMPVVWLGERAPDLQVDCVRSDDATGLRLVVEHLAQLGHRDIAYVGGLGGRVGPDRAAAYRAAMAGQGLAAHVHQITGGFSEEDGARAARELLDGPTLPTAVACSSDQVATGLVSVLRFAGVRVPEEVSVTGYDDSDLAAMSYLDLTTVHQDAALTATETLAAIRRRMSDPATPRQQVATTATLTVRSSTGPVRPGADGS